LPPRIVPASRSEQAIVTGYEPSISTGDDLAAPQPQVEQVPDGKGLLIGFHYDTEPLPGRYPIPGVGPVDLLKGTEINDWGNLAFRWISWNL
jgi:hypothetical protein